MESKDSWNIKRKIKNKLVTVFMFISIGMLFMLEALKREPVIDVPETKNVSFKEDILPITSSICAKCHNSESSDFRVYKNAFIKRSSIYQRVVIDKNMPMGTYMSKFDRAIFRDWINQGGRE